MEKIKGKKRRRKKRKESKQTKPKKKIEKRKKEKKGKQVQNNYKNKLYPATENLKQHVKEKCCKAAKHTHTTLEAHFSNHVGKKSTGIYKNRHVHCDQHVPRRTINTTTVKTYIKN